jgi:hypothetical protein
MTPNKGVAAKRKPEDRESKKHPKAWQDAAQNSSSEGERGCVSDFGHTLAFVPASDLPASDLPTVLCLHLISLHLKMRTEKSRSPPARAEKSARGADDTLRLPTPSVYRHPLQSAHHASMTAKADSDRMPCFSRLMPTRRSMRIQTCSVEIPKTYRMPGLHHKNHR